MSDFDKFTVVVKLNRIVLAYLATLKVLLRTPTEDSKLHL